MFTKTNTVSSDTSWTDNSATSDTFSKSNKVTSTDTFSDSDVTTDAGTVLYLATEDMASALTTEDSKCIIIIGYLKNWAKKIAKLTQWIIDKVNA